MFDLGHEEEKFLSYLFRNSTYIFITSGVFTFLIYSRTIDRLGHDYGLDP